MLNLILKNFFIFLCVYVTSRFAVTKTAKMTFKYHIMAEEFIFTDIIKYKRLTL